MKKKISLLTISLFAGLAATAQMKVYSDGKIAVGSVSTTPSYNLDVISGDVNVNSLTNGYRLNGTMMLWQNNVNTATLVGSGAAVSNTGGYVTAVGYNSMHSNTSASQGTGIGYNSLYSNTTGSYNTAVGGFALYSNTTGIHNSAIGYNALKYNTTTSNSTAMGYGALSANTGAYNTSLGFNAGSSNGTGSYNTYVGYMATASAGTYTNCASFGNGASAGGNDQIRIGNASATVYCQSNVWSSDGRFKNNVKEDVKGIEFIKNFAR